MIKSNRIYVGLSLFFVLMGSGCASTHKTTKTETTVTSNNPAEVSSDQQSETIITSTETEIETKAENPGLISSTFHAVGYVISLPFIIIGGLFRIIFGG